MTNKHLPPSLAQFAVEQLADAGDATAIDLTVQNVEILRAEIVKRDAQIAGLEAELETTLIDWGTLRLEIAALKAHPSAGAIHIVFDGPPGTECGRFVEAEDANGRSINAGLWGQRADGYWELVIKQPSAGVVPGWLITHGRDGSIVVQKPGRGGYVASMDTDNIASSILHALASDMLAARLNPCRAQSVPDGYVLVPVEPTAEMEDAGCQGYMRADGNAWVMHMSSMGHAYKAMLAAAPSAQQKESGDAN